MRTIFSTRSLSIPEGGKFIISANLCILILYYVQISPMVLSLARLLDWLIPVSAVATTGVSKRRSSLIYLSLVKHEVADMS
jgi:hypothetical protein